MFFSKKFFLISIVLVSISSFVIFKFGLAQEMSNTHALENKEIPEELGVKKETFFAFNEYVKIDDSINDDVIAIAKKIEINGSVKGDVLAIAEEIKINGDVMGDVRIISRNVHINSKIKKNVNILGMDAQISGTAEIGGNILFSINKFSSNGIIKGSLKGFARNFEIGNLVEGDIDVTIAKNGSVSLLPGTTIRGNLFYSSPREAIVGENATVLGQINHSRSSEKAGSKKINLFNKIISLFSLLAVGLVLLSLFKQSVRMMNEKLLNESAKCFLWGALFIIFIPIISILLMLTIIGLPLALILLALYAVILYVSQVLTGIALGRILFVKLKRPLSDLGEMILGMLLFTILVSLPIIGAPLRILGILWGTGAIVLFNF